MNTQAVAGFQANTRLSTVDITPQDSALSSLDDRLRDGFASTSVAAQAEYANIIARANDAQYLSTPGNLFELQVRLGKDTDAAIIANFH